jgi:hypothetical protein
LKIDDRISERARLASVKSVPSHLESKFATL